ncbi:tRNA epoxyqueuosine(34) reductase QueG [Novosphingobium album (ex Hu et al. 2023)]|uniref:Epoxyqueuosine reductase n=1 Tax=Novosphingobium album (ex Hu et al. 2023) TaxID=2930093 RepID=A0ABT0B600_9SPHN|nr:tRNA epoxyqueuosine(34) reductase QueG [Novosphingobium album (ex Hu et al. 2023)]MCJ2180476.1 tRNA epoxyqueuosine(34) reductase QueG [Novosphingobium album (ex Hu et al. 2023)]
MQSPASTTSGSTGAGPVKTTLSAFACDLEAEARALGFCAFGVVGAREDSARAERLESWLAGGMHGTMGWMEERAHHRRSPQGLWPEAQSVIALGMSYAPATDPLHLAEMPETARISVYAQGADYHDTVKKALKHLARWIVAEADKRGLGPADVKVFTDTAPVMEKPLAAQAGLGWQGKHTNMVSREHGSWLFLGEIYTTLDLPFSAPARDRCGSCHACQDACPTAAFPAPYRLDARRCVSYLTIEHKEPVPEDLRAGLGNRIYGCDDCLSVCPWNKFAQTAHTMKAFLPRAELTAPHLADLLTLDDTGFRKLFSGSPVKRIGRNRFVRNCLYAAGNSGLRALLVQVEALLDDPDPVVADAAQWAKRKLTA